MWLVGATLDLRFTRLSPASPIVPAATSAATPLDLTVLDVPAKLNQYVDYSGLCGIGFCPRLFPRPR